MGDIKLFLLSVLQNWGALVSGVLGFLVGLWERRRESKGEKTNKFIWGLCIGSLVLAFFLAWDEQYQKAVDYELRASSTQISVDERQRIVEKLQSTIGRLNADAVHAAQNTPATSNKLDLGKDAVSIGNSDAKLGEGAVAIASLNITNPAAIGHNAQADASSIAIGEGARAGNFSTNNITAGDKSVIINGNNSAPIANGDNAKAAIVNVGLQPEIIKTNLGIWNQKIADNVYKSVMDVDVINCPHRPTFGSNVKISVVSNTPPELLYSGNTWGGDRLVTYRLTAITSEPVDWFKIKLWVEETK